MARFEARKCRKDIAEREEVTIDLGTKFIFMYGDGDGDGVGAGGGDGMTVAESINDTLTLPNGVTFNERYNLLSLSRAVVMDLFRPVIDRIATLCKVTLAQCCDCRELYLVGGFGSCPFLEETIRDIAREADVDIRRPFDPQMSIVRGAVLYGLYPEYLSARIMRQTIACAIAVPWQSHRHEDRSRQFKCIGGEKYCLDELDVLVHAGQRVALRSVVEKQYEPVHFH